MWSLFSVLTFSAHADGPVELPPPAPVETRAVALGTFTFSLPGREGASIAIDGFPMGTLPLRTEVLEGLHTVRVTGGGDPVKLTVQLTPTDKVTSIDLAVLLASAAKAKSEESKAETPES